MDTHESEPPEHGRFILKSTAEPTPEVIDVLQKNGLSPKKMIWLAVPNIRLSHV